MTWKPLVYLLAVAGAMGCGATAEGDDDEGEGHDEGHARPVVTVVKTDEYIVEEGQGPVAGTPAGLPVGITADIIVTASDPDGGAVTYTYTSSCAAATFTPPGTVGPAVGVGATPNITRFFYTDPQGTCSISVAVSNRRGVTTTGIVFLSSAPLAAIK